MTRVGAKLIAEDGTLAGAAITMRDAVDYVVNMLQVPLADALMMATLTPARLLRVDDRIGRLKPGYRADLVHLTDALQRVGSLDGRTKAERDRRRQRKGPRARRLSIPLKRGRRRLSKKPCAPPIFVLQFRPNAWEGVEPENHRTGCAARSPVEEVSDGRPQIRQTQQARGLDAERLSFDRARLRPSAPAARLSEMAARLFPALEPPVSPHRRSPMRCSYCRTSR